MKKRTGKTTELPQVLRLLLLTAAFLLGAVLGSVLMGDDSKTGAMLVDGLLGSPRGAAALRLIWLDLVLLALVFGAAFLRSGMVLCGLALAGKGLLLSLTVTACIGTLGTPGWGAAFALVFGSGFLSVAALFLLALQALQPAGRRLQRGRSLPDRVYYLTGALCAVIMGASELVFFYLAPSLARAAVAVFG